MADRIPNYIENPPAYQEISAGGKSISDISKMLDKLEI
jgi:2-oxoglutarate ferredoxin oxidoreductase subunit beta